MVDRAEEAQTLRRVYRKVKKGCPYLGIPFFMFGKYFF